MTSAALPAEPAASTADTTAPGPTARTKMAWNRRRLLLAAASVVGGLALWQFVAIHALLNPLYFPKLTVVAERLQELATSGELAEHTWATMSTFLLGLAISVAVGVVVGVAMASSRYLEALAWPWVMAANSIPRIAVIPIVILFFGLGQSARVTIVVLTAVFPLIVNVMAGLRSVDPELLEMGRAFGAGRTARFRSISLPASVPFLLAGFRIAVAQGLIGVVVAEFFAANRGLGFLLFRASSLFDIPTVYSMMVLLGLAGVLLSEAAKWLEGRFEEWRTQ